jgi:hypothetical protein
MLRKETSRRDNKTLSSILILGAVLAACTPETQPDVSQSVESADITSTETDSGSIIENAVPETTLTPEATATPEIVAMPEFENMHDYCIYRAKQVGIDLENLDNSNNLWLVNQPFREHWQDSFENNFQNPDHATHLIIVGAGATNSLQKYEQMPITSGGHKIILWAEAVIVKADGNAQMVLLPVFIENTQNQLLWKDSPWIGRPFWYNEHNSKWFKNDILNIGNTGEKDGGPEGLVARASASVHPDLPLIAPGTVVNLANKYPSAQLISPEFAESEGLLEEPNFDQSAWAKFINTGDPSELSYWTEVDGFDLPFVFPFMDWHVVGNLIDGGNQKLIGDFREWLESYKSEKSPMPQYWTPLP